MKISVEFFAKNSRTNHGSSRGTCRVPRDVSKGSEVGFKAVVFQTTSLLDFTDSNEIFARCVTANAQ